MGENRTKKKNRINRWFALTGAVILVLTSLLGCSGDNHYGLSAKSPVVITVWTYYNGAQKEAFDKLITEFNETEGRKKGVLVEAVSKGTISELNRALEDSMDKKVGADHLPDVCAAYADIAYQMTQQELTVNLNDYMTDEELEEYVDAYLEEGNFWNDGSSRIFPVAKSTEVLTVNMTEWKRFSEATGVSESGFATWEGITELAEKYYEWTDSQTSELEDGKAFFGRDAFANYILVGSNQLGHKIFEVEDGAVELDLDKESMRRLWDMYYVPYINGYFGAFGKFRSDDMKTGDLVAFVGATSGAAYTPTSVQFEDGTNKEITCSIYPTPNFEGTSPSTVQQGAGMVLLKSEPKREYASIVFLKWFTELEQNLEFCLKTGYMPVKKEANDESVFQNLGEEPELQVSDIELQSLQTGMQAVREYELYVQKPFAKSNKVRDILEESMVEQAKADRTAVTERISQGMSRREAVALYHTDENFDHWFETLQAQLLLILGE